MSEDEYTSEYLNDATGETWPLGPFVEALREVEDVPLPGDDMPKKPLRISHMAAEDVARVIDALGPTNPSQADRVLEVVNDLVRAAVASYEDAITWDTTCLNCSSLMDQLYEDDMKIERILDKVRDVVTARGAGDFSPILPKLSRIVKEES